jgi:hypothetical protein
MTLGLARMAPSVQRAHVWRPASVRTILVNSV